MYTVGRGLISSEEFIGELAKKVCEFQIATNNKKISYYNIPAGFDIEVTSFYDHGEKRGIMYHWQFGIGNLVTTGRTWAEYIEFIRSVKIILGLSDSLRLLVYVHNLPYEFQFIRKRFEWEEVFLLDNRKPVYANNHGIEYRCSLKLAGGKSLENVGKDLHKYKVNKAKGDLDYSIIRTPLTPLTKKELYYCEMDIRVILSYIQEKIEQDGDITRIPLTNTGYVREYCRKECFKRWKPYHNLMYELTVEPDEYRQLKRAFQGGFTHANAHHVGKLLFNVASDDFNSSYPAVMVLEQFPMSKGRLIEENLSKEELEKLMRTKCCLFDIELNDVIPIRHQDHPISKSKCWKLSGYTTDNGRIVTADSLVTTITEQDYFIYKEFYKWRTCTISRFRVYDKAYLPRPFILAILELYRKKTSLKGIVEELINYMISKNMLNAGFGMTVTDPLRDLFKYIENSVDSLGRATDFPKLPRDDEGRLEKYNDNVKRFLFYPWGVWITAYARANLFSAILEMGDDHVYSDTDSDKYLNPEKHQAYFQRYNAQIMEKIEKSSKYNKIPYEMYAPEAKGKEKPIGLWDYEGTYRCFKTEGAKRYMVMKHNKKQDDVIHFTENGMDIELQNNMFVLTMAGVNKKKAMEYLIKTGDPFGSFTPGTKHGGENGEPTDGLVIPAEYSGRLLLTYIDYHTHGILVDCNGVPYEYDELSSVFMEPAEYNMSISDDFDKYLKGILDISE